MASQSVIKLGISLFYFVLYTFNCVYSQDFEITFTIQEELPKWTFVGNVSDASGFMASIPPEDRNHLSFGFLQQTNIKSILSIHDETGSLFTTVVIDRESISDCRIPAPCILSFDIAAQSDRKDSPLFEIISVNVVIKDKNDNAPTFPHNVQTISISEAATNGSSYQIDNANDDDTGDNNSIQSYELIGNKNLFSLDVEPKLDGSLSVKLVVIGQLDREKTDHYRSTIIARDGGKPQRSGSMTLNITIADENDNAPIFSKTAYNVTVKEDTPGNTGIVQINATDIDIGDNSLVLYRFSPHQSDLNEIKALFYIHEHTGVLSVTGRLTYEPDKVFKIIVEAIDQGDPPRLSTNQAIVTVNVEDTGNNPPSVKVNLLTAGSGRVVNVSEFSTKGTFVAHVEVTDKDTGRNGEVVCIVGSPYFALEPITNKGFKIVVAKPLDSDTEDLITVIVTCRDNGSPVLQASDDFLVKVTDENDNPPRFVKSNYVAEIYENNNRGDVVTTVRAIDADKGQNARIEYYLDTTVRRQFAVDASTGVIRALDRFDRENRTSWTFKVFAKDFGVPSLVGNATVNVIIKDKNDVPPRFTNSTFYFHIRENLPSGSEVDRLRAYDNDLDENGKFTYVISNTKEKKLPFSLFADGVIKTTMELDREIKSAYQFTVIAIDKGEPKLTSSANVVIRVDDDNDLSPRIIFPKPDNNTVVIDHLKPSGTYVTQIEAYDGDIGVNGKLAYVIEEGNAERLFLLNLNTGILSMAQVHEVEEGEEENYRLVIAVHDGGIPQRSQREELNVIIKYSNETTTQSSPVDGPNTNIVIVVVVILLTFCLSVAIIIVICVIRKFDRDRAKCPAIEINKLPNNMTDISDHQANGSVVMMSRSYDKADSLKKKKEVSFSFEDDLDGLRDHEVSFSNNSVFSENHIAEVPNHERQQSHEMKTFQLQHALMNAQNKQWNQMNAHKIKEGNGIPNEKDNHSDTSRETVTSDSGRGGSEDDLPTSHNNSKEERDVHLSNKSRNSKLMKSQQQPNRYSHCESVPQNYGIKNNTIQHQSQQHCRNTSRPQSTDLSDRLTNKQLVDRSLSNLVEGEKPKFTVRKPYMEKDSRRDKKPDNWFPSYV
ncbi:Protocadherin Fat 4 [Mactra antiquata]